MVIRVLPSPSRTSASRIESFFAAIARTSVWRFSKGVGLSFVVLLLFLFGNDLFGEA